MGVLAKKQFCSRSQVGARLCKIIFCQFQWFEVNNNYSLYASFECWAFHFVAFASGGFRPWANEGGGKGFFYLYQWWI